jgi:translocation and assembly module TamB
MKALRVALALAGSTVGLLLALVLALLCALWLWSGNAQSLEGTLAQVARWLPADQTLQSEGVTGSLQRGGSIAWLRWQRGELAVELRDATLSWSPRALLDGQIHIPALHAKLLRIEDHRPADPTAVQPPKDLHLPIAIDVTLSLDTVEYAGATTVQLQGFAAHYVFDSNTHTIHEGRVHIASGDYQFDTTLQASAPLALSVQVSGTVQATVPSRQSPVQVAASATVQGTLAGQDAALDVAAQLSTELPKPVSGKPTVATSGAKPNNLHAQVNAHIRPWQAQPIAQANAQWQGLDLASLWPQAPLTRLSGSAAVTPQAAAWAAELMLDNTQSGPWDQQRLPIEHLQTKLIYDNSGQWRVQTLQASAAGGRLQAQGQFTSGADTGASASTQWQGSASAQGIHPEAIDSRLGQAVLDGQLSAQQTPKGIAFDLQLLPTATPKPATASPRAKKAAAPTSGGGIQLQSLNAKGLWTAPTVTLDSLTVQTDDANVQGHASVNTQTFATQGKLAITLPGALASVDGAISSDKGQGNWSVRVADAAQTTRWVTRLPGLGGFSPRMSGNGEFDGTWQGGWQGQGQNLQVQATLRVPTLKPQPTDANPQPPWQLKGAIATLSGKLPALRLRTDATVAIGEKTLALKGEATGGRVADGRWQAQLQALQLQVRDPQRPGIWAIQLPKPVTLDWSDHTGTRMLAVAPGTLQLTGPVEGTMGIHWQGAQWSNSTDGGKKRTQWHTQGRIDDLPLAWLDWLGHSQLANLGLQGDMRLNGQWDASGGDTLRIQASLARSSGDLQIQTDVAQAPRVQAGVREARIAIAAEGDQISASAQWDSARAGKLQADFGTRLQRADNTWTWPNDAPLQGRAKVQMPPLGVWSILAPPGWRLRGTLDADASLSGTRAAPQWSGTVAAQDLSVRSVVDGIDFSQGRLRARLAGQRLEIDELSVHGAGGASGTKGGLLDITGAVWWLPGLDANPGATTLARLRMQLQATAQALRLSDRADRKLVVTGKLSADLDNAVLVLRGKLLADEALFQIADQSAPQLGDDVVVRTPTAAQAAQTAPIATPPTPGQRLLTDLDITLDPGPNFVVRGRGINTRLAGELVLRRVGAKAPLRLIGTLRTVGGSYKAYGQNLDIEQGVMRFEGPYDNPSLDILAIRPNLQQRVGVQIVGTVQVPVVRLYSDPDLPDSEKLAWLVLGRSGANGGAETAVLQQAAMALLGGKGNGLSSQLMDALGIDELSVRSDGATNPDGTTSATVVLGKRVSRDFYLAYERGVASTMGTLSIFYDLSRRFALRAQAGEESAVDLIFTLPYD